MKLTEIGYSARLLRRKILEVRQEVRWRFVLKMLLRRPGLVVTTARRYLNSLIVAQWLAYKEETASARTPLVKTTAE